MASEDVADEDDVEREKIPESGNGAAHESDTQTSDERSNGAEGARLGTVGSIEPAEQVAAEAGEARTLGHGTSGGDDYTAINPGGTSVEESSSEGDRSEH
jgi:hypothetical protein